MTGVAEDLDGGGTDAGVFCAEEIFEKGLADLIETPGDPEGFEEDVLVAGGVCVEGFGPLLEGGEDFVCVTLAEFAAGAVAGAELGEGEIFKEGEVRRGAPWMWAGLTRGRLG